MAKVLFINPIVREEDVARHIPYGIALLAAIAIEKGHLVQIYDANAWRLGDSVLQEVCLADSWDIVAIGGLTTSYGYIKNAVRLIRSILPKCLIVGGGGFLTSMPKEIMEWLPEIDVGIVGEAFVTFPEVLENYAEGDNNFESTLGVVRRDSDHKVLLNRTRPIISDLDVLPWPAWDLLPLEEIYFPNSSSLFSEDAYLAKRRIDVNASFGCNLVCRYCWHLGTTGDMLIEENAAGENDVVFTYGRNIRYHSPDYIVDMVRELHQKYKVDFVSFLDENLMTMDAASGRTWLKEICEKWIDNGLAPASRVSNRSLPNSPDDKGVFWSGTSHATLHRPEILELMYKAGCAHLVYGLETFDPGILKNLGKGSTRQKNIDSVRICMESGIRPIPNIIIGFPEESFSSIRNTIEALIDLGIHAKPHFATAYPGSEWFYTYKDSITEQYAGNMENYILDLGDATKITAVISHEFSAMELLGLQEIVRQRNLRLLTQAETVSNATGIVPKGIAVPKESFNFRPKNRPGPIENSTN